MTTPDDEFPFSRPVRFLLSHYLTADEVFHLAQVSIPHTNRLPDHDHDFPELFWVKSGKGIHYINGESTPLTAGDMLFLRTQDAHTLTAHAGGVMVIVNLAFSTATLAHYRTRYFLASTKYFWHTGAQPYSAMLSRTMINALDRVIEETASSRSPLVLDRLLTFLFQHLESITRSHDTPLTPDWLAAALDAFTTPAHFQTGVAGFVALTHHCAEHVNRTVRRCYGLTTTAVVNQARMQFAAHQLRMTNRSVLAICHDCGIENLGHFYALFKRLYAMTPIAYRKHHHSIATHSSIT